ncbi:LLM class flavin-dependent oxidoreductase [Corynebacterium guangdongense]|uniref:LLM family oxidoreductase n=1 Tax=Corynebacterium guangdongense TaxID=1783348 RepID=A0ABU1ZY63_9CORY|nr:LLM class flavin-dependent oxidoreductase [Corynebacterium guangdongense]MDR7329705.1 putative LLM family oxidoreductase [Corynebacterium guangdongense]WJZ18269.1 Limonene 1,2-monooxygenase [Corynebacterium guangdongense]
MNAIDPNAIEFGLDTFGDVQSDLDGNLLPHAQVIRNVVEEAVLADEVGIDVFGIGEHHREDYAVPAPEMLLSNIAARTQNIRLTTSVIVLSSNDPVRLYEQFSTLQALSDGRAEMTLGRGSFTESFPLFGFSMRDYETLFEEKLDLTRRILDADAAGETVTWSGTTRASLENQGIWPPAETPIPTWVAVGGSPESVIRAARQRMPLMLAIIGGAPARFRPYVDLFHQANEQIGNEKLPVGAHFYGFVAETDEEAQEKMYPYWERVQTLVGRDRGWPAPTPDQFYREIHHGAMHLGSVETVAQKTANSIQALGLDRFVFKYSNGPIPHEYSMDAIRLIGEQVIPRVREILTERAK